MKRLWASGAQSGGWGVGETRKLTIIGRAVTEICSNAKRAQTRALPDVRQAECPEQGGSVWNDIKTVHFNMHDPWKLQLMIHDNSRKNWLTFPLEEEKEKLKEVKRVAQGTPLWSAPISDDISFPLQYPSLRLLKMHFTY